MNPPRDTTLPAPALPRTAGWSAEGPSRAGATSGALPRRRPDVGRAWQVALVVVAWGYLCGLHWGNDGLWYQGDAPRHAANGIFWKDFLLSPSLDPKGYALSYYARYPIIAPTIHPPGFYLLESAAFAILGASPYVAKALVLGFALMEAIYTTAWLRRWVAPEAGLAGAPVLLLPGTVLWSHAIMLNVPATALGLGALYHGRRALGAPIASETRGHAIPAGALVLATVFTYYSAGVVVLVLIAWALAFRGRRRPAGAKLLAIGAAGASLVATILLAALAWAPTHVTLTLPRPEKLWTLSNWTYYAERLPLLFGPPLLALAALGIAGGALARRWRREAAVLALWVVVVYLAFSAIRAREERYLLPLGPPVVISAAIAVLSAARWVGARTGRRQGAPRAAAIATMAALIIIQAWLATQVRVESIRGFKEVVAFLERAAPDEAILYDGYLDGIFTFYLRAGDPGYRRRVVLGHKLLYTYAYVPGWRMRQFASSPKEVVEVLRERGGCRWLALELGDQSELTAPARLLRQTVEGPQFELVKSFPIMGRMGINRVDVYRLLFSIREPGEVDLPFPILGDDDHYPSYRVRPIRPRSRRGRVEPSSPGARGTR